MKPSLTRRSNISSFALTTLLKAIMGIGDIQSGEILIDGRPAAEQYERMAYITEEGSFLPNMTPIEYGVFLADYFPNYQMKRYRTLLEFFQMPMDRKIKSFSKGQKSKLEVSAGFSKGAKYMLMDEPFLGSDPLTRRDFLKLMISNMKDDETILITTHLIDEIEHIIDRAVILHEGRIKADRYMDDLREEGKELVAWMEEITGTKKNMRMQVFS